MQQTPKDRLLRWGEDGVSRGRLWWERTCLSRRGRLLRLALLFLVGYLHLWPNLTYFLQNSLCSKGNFLQWWGLSPRRQLSWTCREWYGLYRLPRKVKMSVWRVKQVRPIWVQSGRVQLWRSTGWWVEERRWRRWAGRRLIVLLWRSAKPPSEWSSWRLPRWRREWAPWGRSFWGITVRNLWVGVAYHRSSFRVHLFSRILSSQKFIYFFALASLVCLTITPHRSPCNWR